MESKLSEAKKKLTEAEQGRSADLEQHVEFVETLRIRIASLEDKIKKASEDQEAAFKDGEATGQVTFMKAFMKKIPGFDWGQLGEATKVYAEDLRQELEEEEAKEAEAEALRITEEEAHKKMDAAS